MPKAMEQALKRSGAKKGLKGKRLDAYVYATMNKEGYMHGNKRTSKGRGKRGSV